MFLLSTIHLIGNYIDQFPFGGQDDDESDFESDSEYDSEGYPLEDSEDDEEDSDVDMADLEKVVGRKGR